jgi:LysM repeat protein
MGLFSFLKNAGRSLREDNSEEAAEAKDRLVEKKLIEVFYEHKLPINDFSVDVEDDKVIVYGTADNQADKEKAILAIGNVDGIASVDDRISVLAAPEAPAAPQATFYEVQSGDSLSKIAKAHYGDPMKYMAIFEANQPLLKDPNMIYPGQMLRIPAL